MAAYRFVPAVLALIAIVSYPYPFGILFAAISALFIPPLALLYGVLFDVLYFVPGASAAPLGTVLGLIGWGMAVVMHDFVKTRIIGG